MGNLPHIHPLEILRVRRSTWSHQGLSFQLGGFHRWDPMALLPAAGVHRLHLPLPIDDHFLDPSDGNQKAGEMGTQRLGNLEIQLKKELLYWMWKIGIV